MNDGEPVTPGRASYEARMRSAGSPPAWHQLSDDERAHEEAGAQAALETTVSGLLDAAGITQDELAAAVTEAVRRDAQQQP